MSDPRFMRETFTLAKKAEGFTSPNPLVGALIVRNGKVLARGYHQKCGKAHAEIEAIRKLKIKDCRGATLYVNLEPCCHFGRTPPCVDTIIEKKFERVVIATKDPTSKVNGKSVRKLKKAGIRVDLGLLAAEAKKINQVFFKNTLAKRPFVVAKLAQSLDGKIATKDGVSKWITSSKSRDFARTLRDKYDCVLVGVNTLIKDDSKLSGVKRVPFRVVVDPNLRIPAKAYILKNKPEKTIIITSLQGAKLKNKLPKEVKLIVINKSKNNKISVRKILKSLYLLGLVSVFVEGGAETIGRFFDEKIVDKVYFFIAPKIIGGKSALSSVGAKGISSLNQALLLKDIEIERIKGDILISGYPK